MEVPLHQDDQDGVLGPDDLLPLVYEDLRRLAASKMGRENPGQTLQATALVHEAWLRISAENHRWANRRQFFSAAAEAMRRILIERARQRQHSKRGGGLCKVALDELDLAEKAPDETLLAVHEALNRFALLDPVAAELIKLRFFTGLSNAEAAKMLGLSERGGKRNWAYARAWLRQEMRGQA